MAFSRAYSQLWTYRDPLVPQSKVTIRGAWLDLLKRGRGSILSTPPSVSVPQLCARSPPSPLSSTITTITSLPHRVFNMSPLSRHVTPARPRPLLHLARPRNHPSISPYPPPPPPSLHPGSPSKGIRWGVEGGRGRPATGCHGPGEPQALLPPRCAPLVASPDSLGAS